MLGGFQAAQVASFRPPCVQLPRGNARCKVVASSSPFNQVVTALVNDEGTRSLLVDLHEMEVNATKEKDELRLEITELRLQSELVAVQRRLMDSNTALAKERGLLNCRGMVELIEEEMIPNNGRAALWEDCLDMEEFKPLRDCLLGVTGSQARTSKALGQSVASFYGELSLSVHGHNSKEEWIASKDTFNIGAALLSKPRARMLACMAEFLMIKYSTNVTASSDDGDDDGNGDEVESDESGENKD